MATILSFMEVGDVQYIHVHSKLKATCNLTFYRVSVLSVRVLHFFTCMCCRLALDLFGIWIQSGLVCSKRFIWIGLFKRL
jgi:hypothetical protein